ncbi:MAG: magnesium/cobalt transporter CorA [Candidatus Latescibacteria bacterium]|nr:magnesium/cobalt transporter CorA [Candidatus Latescibacterota bacterium]
MITIYSYNIAEGTLSCPSVDELPAVYESGNVDLWVDLEAPTYEDANILRTVFDFHELAIEDCITADIEEAKLDDYENYFFLVFHSVFFNMEKLSFDINELDLFFGKNYVVTHHKKPTTGINQLKKRLERGIDFMALGTDEILHAIIDSLVDNYTVTFKHIERSIYALETEILSEPTKKTFNDLFKLKRGLINLRRIFTPEEEVIESLAQSEHELIQEENTIYFQDIHDHMSTIQGLLNSYLEMVTGTMDTYVTITNHRMTGVMQMLTIISTIMLPPTLIASLYGMNFIHMPLLESPIGFEIITAICFLFAGSMLWWFKKQDWF